MSVVLYKCDTCKREIELRRNIEGLERIQRCVITLGCRGKLYQVDVLEDYIRTSLPEPVSGLLDWQQRRILYNHQQVIAREEWTIEHNLGVFPVVSVFVDRPTQEDPENREEITPVDIVPVDKNTIKLVFDRSWSGIAQLIGRQSDPNLLEPFDRAPPPSQEQQLIQMSSGGEITIATKISDTGTEPVIQLNVRYVGASTVPDILYGADDQPSLLSPWNDFNRVLIGGKLYTVRSFNGLIPEMTTGAISNGASIRFVGIDRNSDNNVEDILPGEVLILLASPPFENVDKRRDVFVDVTDVTEENNPFGFAYNSGEFFVDTQVIETTYPPIRPV